MQSLTGRVRLLLVFPSLYLTGLGLLVLSNIDQQLYGFSLNNQLVAVGAAFVAAVIGYSMPKRRLLLRRAAWWYVAALLLLTLTLFIGVTAGGATRWIAVGDFNIQTSELAKVALVVLLAALLGERYKLSLRASLLAVAAASAPVLSLIFLQPDLSSTIILAVSVGGMLLLTPIGWRSLFVSATVLSGIGFIGYSNLAPYQQERINSFRTGPESDPLGAGYNVIQAQTAIGQGGLLGRGLSGGSQTETGLLPEAHTDFIFAVTAEKLGLVGAASVIVAAVAILSSIISVVRSSQERWRMSLAAGLFGLLAWPFVINILMNLGLIPATGVPLPFMSFGGTHIAIEWFIVGLLSRK